MVATTATSIGASNQWERASSVWPFPVAAAPRLLSRWLVVSALLFASCDSLLAAGSPPPLRLPFQSLGIQLLNSTSGLGPVSPTTVDFADDRHLLVTYGVRRLMKRLPDDPPEDEDHTIAAILVDLDTGKVLARNEWRLHDYQRYLWPLGHGHFLLRNRNHFSTIAPLVHLSGGHPFAEGQLLSFDRRILGVLLSPEGDFLTIETGSALAAPAAPKKQSPMAAFNAAISPPSNVSPGPDSSYAGPELQSPSFSEVQISFFRLGYPQKPSEPVLARIAGRARADRAVVVPVNANGYISVVHEGKSQAWAMDFNTYTGKAYELPLYDSACQPHPMMISKSELLAFGCRPKDNQHYFAAFNLLGEQMWQKGLYDSSPLPALAFAPGTGRFAVNRLVVEAADSSVNLTQATHNHPSTQTVDVYQINSGRQLIHLVCSPVESASQNFSLSPDGMGLAVLNNGAIEIYELPEATAKEEAANQKALAAAPEDLEVPVRLGPQEMTAGATSAAQADSSTTGPTVPASAPVAISDDTSRPPAPTPEQTGNTVGDAPPEARRKPPTLYGSPDEVPANQRQDAPR